MDRIKNYLILLIIIQTCLITAPVVDGAVINEGEAARDFENFDFVSLPTIGQASYYSYECSSAPMANGQPFNPMNRTCASWFYKFGTVLVVTSLDTGKSTEVIVTDRGPNKRLVRKGRIIDLSLRSFQDICDTEKGLTRVVVKVKPVLKNLK